MKNISIYLLVLGCLQANIYGMGLEKPELDEFIQNKKRIVELGRQLPDHATNKLLAKYAEFTADEADVLVKLDEPSLQNKIKEMFASVANQPTYKETLQEAIAKKSDNDWNAFRQANGKLLREFLATKGFIPTDPKNLVKGMLEANKDIQPDATEYAVASSFLIYYTRAIQRNVTGNALPAIPIS